MGFRNPYFKWVYHIISEWYFQKVNDEEPRRKTYSVLNITGTERGGGIQVWPEHDIGDLEFTPGRRAQVSLSLVRSDSLTSRSDSLDRNKVK